VREALAAGPGRPADRRPFRSLVFLPACVILLASAVSGCASTTPGNGAPPCFPPAFSVAPSSAKPGDRVTVMAPDAVCDPRYGGNARIQVTLTDAAGVEVLTATAPMHDAGGFSYAFDVPAGTAAGEAAITAMPFNIDWCDDTGRNNRVAGAGATVTLERVSCVIPTRPLTITR
jgi:hypothetical protein